MLLSKIKILKEKVGKNMIQNMEEGEQSGFVEQPKLSTYGGWPASGKHQTERHFQQHCK